MIQRLQSLWLLAAAVCAVLTFRFSFFSGNKMGTDNKPVFEKLVASSHFLLLILTVALAAGCVFIIFLYKDRNKQQWLTIAAAAVSVINLIIYFGQLKKFIPNEGAIDLTSIIAFSIPVFLVLAVRGIWKDEKLVKSLDRLR